MISAFLDVDTSKQVYNIDTSSDRALEDSSSPGEISLLSFNDDIVTVHLKEKRDPNPKHPCIRHETRSAWKNSTSKDYPT